MVPNIVHFIWFTGPKSREFGFVNYLAVRAAHDIQKPDALYIHTNIAPTDNPHWEAIRPYAQIVIREPSELTDIPQYQADLARLEILSEGGIYLDTDMLLIKPLAFERTTMGVESYENDWPKSLNAGLIAAVPNCRFIAEWRERMAGQLGVGGWAHHCVVLACEIYHENPALVDLRPAEEFLPFDFHDEWIYGSADQAYRLANSYSMHLYDTYWEGVEWSELRKIDNDYLATVDNLFTYMFGKYRIGK